MKSLEEHMKAGRYQSYSYSYPHKTAYRPLESPRGLDQVWAEEKTDSLFLYMHIPFCEMRCGFCNLFTVAKPASHVRDSYVDVLSREAALVDHALPDREFSRMAVGGGTPSQLDAHDIARLFDVAESLGALPREIPVSFEVSPDTLDGHKLDVMKERGVSRVSIGVQSFVPEETSSARRPQKIEDVHGALDGIGARHFDVFNIDLIYGLPGQTKESWRYSLEQALEFGPNELYLYPLYVRPLTGLGNSSKSWDDERADLYRAGRDFLLERGFEQHSMRMFTRVPSREAPDYACQQDGMVGLGVGARSYTDRLHYSSEYAVGRRKSVDILHDFVGRDDAELGKVGYGFELGDSERKRRHVILSLLSRDGLDAADFERRFSTQVIEEFPELAVLEDAGYVESDETRAKLTPQGVEWSDAIGPWLYSKRVLELSAEYELR